MRFPKWQRHFGNWYYLRYRSEKNPTRRMFNRFNRFYGSGWTEEYIHGFQFDLERKS
ncbi:hypothetical protein [Pseudanabaena sp. UWO310]|uniref:hypothetical protein n=1 Tax=Pseudanabaena sp. UWO310 TaxID=2480795 RepID=UPI0021E07DCB|nr:hypothetical protein [Pseudanabaena sp. UWO310]